MSEYKVQLKVTTQQEYLDGKKIPRVGNTVLETVSAANSTEAANKAKSNYKKSNHFKNIVKNQDSTKSPKNPRVSVIKVFGGGPTETEAELTDPTFKIDQYTKGGKHGGLVVRGYGIAKRRKKVKFL
tara:strand:- start:201 stop:581 length:381 start_codon:yes stop_codon:yes gene_type:complete